MRFAFIILAAGNSTRFKGRTPKQYKKIFGKTLLELLISKIKKIRHIEEIIIVYNNHHKKYLKKIKLNNVKKIEGGNSRQISTLKALKFLKQKKNIDQVLIHDASRPNTSLNLIKKIILESKKNRIVIPYIKIEDSLKFKSKNKFINQKRENFILTQTPQSFRFNDIFLMHKNNKNQNITDDMSLFENKEKIKLILGEKKNLKITTYEDFENFKKSLINKNYYGIGFDIHRLVKKRKLFLGGVNIPFKFGLMGHSDGDVVLHAITDAILGASKLGDIGEYFSDKNSKYKNIKSSIILKKVMKLTNEKNYILNGIDINIICEKPRIQKIKNKIINNISKLTHLDKEKINLKGKTSEKLGIIGKENAIASEAIVSLIKYD